MTNDTIHSDELASVPQWPKIIGIVSTCLAVLSFGCGGCGIFQNFGSGPKQGLSQAFHFTILDMISQGMGLVSSVILLAAGITLIMRKNVGKVLHIVYASLSFPLLALGAYLQLTHLNEVQQWLRDNPAAPEAKAGGAITGMMIGIFAIVVIFFGGYSLFLLAWMISKRKADLGGTAMSEIV